MMFKHCAVRTQKIGRYFYCWIFQFLLKFGDHLKLKIRRGAQILVLQSHSEVVKMSSILFLYSKKALLAESSTKITGGRKTLKNKFLQKFLQGSTFTKKSQDFQNCVTSNCSNKSFSSIFFSVHFIFLVLRFGDLDRRKRNGPTGSFALLSLDQSCQTRCMGCVTMTAHKTI